MNRKYAQVIVENKATSTDKPYTYIIEPDMIESIREGIRVLVPFGRGNRIIIGIVIKIQNNCENHHKLKSIIDVIDDKPLISKDMIDLSLWMSEHYLSPYVESFQTVLPPGNFKEVKTYVFINKDNIIRYREKLTPLEEDIINLIRNKDGKTELGSIKKV